MKPRAAWPVLAKKAKEKCDEAFAELKKARDRVTHLEQSRERMQLLYADYVARSKEAESRPHSMSETLNYRGFMQQLQSLVSRVEIDYVVERLAAVRQRRAAGLPTIPSTVALERATNPFVRAADAAELGRLRGHKDLWRG